MAFIRLNIAALFVLIAIFTFVTHAQIRPNPVFVSEVQAGLRDEANAAWWGFDAEDSTRFIQAAIDSGVSRLVIPNMGQDWIVRPITLRSDLEIIFEDGVVVKAKKGEFHGPNDSLFSAWDVENLVMRGYGAVLRMHKGDYASSDYEHAQWRMGIEIRGSKNVQILGLTIQDTGGDGIYLGRGSLMNYNENVVIRHVTAQNNYRQGISVISAKNLLIENSIFKNTGGTAPRAGIDFEPNRPDERMENIIVRNSIFENNDGPGILVYLSNLNNTSEKVSILLENIIVRGNPVGINFHYSSLSDDHPEGEIVVRNCMIEDATRFGIRVRNKNDDGAMQIRLEDCILQNVATNRVAHVDHLRLSVPIYFDSQHDLHGVAFQNVVIVDKQDRPAVYGEILNPTSESGFFDIEGEIKVVNPYGAKSRWDGVNDGPDVKMSLIPEADSFSRDLLNVFESELSKADERGFSWPRVIIRHVDRLDNFPVDQPFGIEIDLPNFDKDWIESIKITLDGEILYRGRCLPGEADIIVDPASLGDGNHELIVSVDTGSTGVVSESREFWTLAHLHVDHDIPITNWGFEDPVVRGTPPGWSSNGDSFAGRPWISVSDEFSREGDYSLKLTGRASGGSAVVRSDRVPAIAGMLYSASASVYMINAVRPYPRMYLEYWDTEGNLLRRDRASAPGIKQDWVRVKVEGTAPQNAAYVTIWFYTNTNFNDVAYWDDVKLKVFPMGEEAR